MRCDVCEVTDQYKRIRNINGMNLCPKHLTQWYRHKGFNDSTIYKNNDYVINKDYAEIILRNKNCEEVGRAIIDIDDVEKCKKYKWHARKSHNITYCIASCANNEKIHLHRYVIGYSGTDDVDHINRNGLDNRKSNLRVLSHSDNLRNQASDRKGIKKVPSGRYQVCITKMYVEFYIGTFDTYDEALTARINAENEM